MIETILAVPAFLGIGAFAMLVDLKAKFLAILDEAEGYRMLAIKSQDRGEREAYERIVELYVEIAEQLEALIHS